MVYAVSYIDWLAVWWDPRRDFKKGYKYRVWINDACVITDQILYDFRNLIPGTTYKFRVELLDEENNLVGKTEYFEASTKKGKKLIDVTKPPYNVVGDGVTDYTDIISKLLNECKPDECIYFPLGRYVCNSVNFGGNCTVRMDEGAVFCLSDKESK